MRGGNTGCAVETKKLRWFDHVKKMVQGEPLGGIQELEVTGRRSRGRPEKQLKEDCGDRSKTG